MANIGDVIAVRGEEYSLIYDGEREGMSIGHIRGPEGDSPQGFVAAIAARGYWKEVKPAVKSVTSEPMFKHPGHGDQKVHGRRFGSTVDQRIANEAIELTRQNGGLSINMVDGSEPPNGFMVARDSSKFGTVVKADDFFDPEKGPKLLGAHVVKNRTELLSGRAYLGVWHQTEAARKGPDGKNVKGPDGKDIMDPLPRDRQLVHLDVTDNISDKRRAISLGRRRDQISVWDVSNFEEVQTGGKGGNVSG